jgi:hypothetical protein
MVRSQEALRAIKVILRHWLDGGLNVAIDGTYAVAYCGSIGLGVAMLKVDNGQVIGHDYVGSVIAGIATELPNGEIDLDVSMLVQSGAHLVVGTSAQDLPYARGHQTPIPPGVRRWCTANRTADAGNDDGDGETRSRQLGSRSHEGLLDSVETLNA